MLLFQPQEPAAGAPTHALEEAHAFELLARLDRDETQRVWLHRQLPGLLHDLEHIHAAATEAVRNPAGPIDQWNLAQRLKRHCFSALPVVAYCIKHQTALVLTYTGPAA